MTYYVCSLPNPGQTGEPKELFTDDLVLANDLSKARMGGQAVACMSASTR
jgi:hypothetical protein